MSKSQQVCRWCNAKTPEGQERCSKCNALLPQEPLAWLHCPPFASIPLVKDRTVTIGRDPDCQFSLPHPSVSRCHAAVVVEGEAIRLEDRSSFGTFLNGDEVENAPLKMGDRITLGPYEIELSLQKRQESNETTRPLDARSGFSGPLSVLIVGNLPVRSDNLAGWVDKERALQKCAQASSAREAIDLIERRSPALILYAMDFSNEDPFPFIGDVAIRFPSIPSVIVFGPLETTHVERALKLGIKGYMDLHEPLDRLRDAIGRVIEGERFLSEAISQQLGSKDTAEQGPGQILTERELEVFRMLGRGLKTRQVATDLEVSIKTIESHRANIKRKLNLKSGSELLYHAVRWVRDREG